MSDRKFTDDEVIKALEWCVEGTSEACLKCVFGLTPPYPVCKTMIEKHALALINRQKAEIERLQWGEYRHIGKTVINARKEAVEEFAERLKEYKQKPEFPWDDWFVVESVIDNLVKEMTEGGEPRKETEK